MQRIFTTLTLVLLAMVVFTAPIGAASRVWCARDPIVTVDGTVVQIWVAVPDEYAAYVNDAVEVNIRTPKDVDRQVIFLDEGFNGHGERVKWFNIKDENPNDDVIPMEVEVRVKFDKQRMMKDFDKKALAADLGKGKEVPVMVTVNIGELSENFETTVYYGGSKKTKFDLSVVGQAEAGD